MEKVVFVDSDKSFAKNGSLKGFTLIVGFPDVGLAGTIASKYLIEKMGMKQIGFIESDYLLPVVRVQNGLPLHPMRICADKKNKLVVILSEQMVSGKSVHQTSRELVDWIKKKGIKKVISTSGVKIPEGNEIYAFASDENSKEIIKKMNIDLVGAGISSGVTALLMLGLRDKGIDAFCLLGNAKSSADYNAASVVIKTICSIVGIKAIDTKPLMLEAKQIEQSLVQHLKDVGEKSECSTSGNTAPMYT
jgi:uncharacterized protein